MERLAMPLGRLFLSLIFILGGLSKLGNLAGTGAYMQSAGVPAVLAAPAGLFELVAGLAILIGYRTRIAALLLAGFCLLTTVLFHTNFADQIQAALALKNVAMAGGFLLLFAHGAGAMSLDERSKG